MAIAEIRDYHGEPALVIGEKSYPPFNYCASNHSSGKIETDGELIEHIRLRYAEGERLIYLLWGFSDWLQPGIPGKQLSASEELLHKCRLVLDNLPGDVYLGVMINLNPPVSWVESHPEELVRYNDGKTHPLFISATGKAPGMFSLCSEVFRRDAGKALSDMLDKIDAAPFADRIVSVVLAGGGTCEWYYPEGNPFTDRKTGTWGDFSEPFRRNFEEFLRAKYGDEETLRRVWKDPDASFRNPKIPDLRERTYVNIDDTILDSMANYESSYRQLGKTLNLDGHAETNLGVFLNANRYQHVADFYQAIHYGTAKTLEYFGSIVKNRAIRRMVVTFYGALGCTDYFNFGTCGATLELLDSGKVDMLCSAASYNNRDPGGYLAHREIQDSFLLHGAMFSNEGDSRCHYTAPFYRDLMRMYGVRETVNTMKREFAQQLCENMQGWWYNFDPAFVKDGIFSLLKRMKEVALFHDAQDRRRHHEIAFLYDLESIHYVSNDTDAMLMEFYRVSELGRIGAPGDFYFHNDVSNPAMPDYKLYVMVNVYCLTESEREAIAAKARRNHACVLWLYAPGFIDTGAGEIMSNENIRKTTGMKVCREDRTVSPRFRVTVSGKSPLRWADPDRCYGCLDRDVHSCIWPGSVYAPPKIKPLPPAFANPGFSIEEQEGTAVLGRNCLTGKPAMAMKEMDGYTSVYCTAATVRSEILASLAEYAGAHLYTHTDDFISADDTLVSIHAHWSGRRSIYFKQACSPFEVYEKRYYGRNVTEIEVEMRIGETLTFSVRGEC